MAYDPQWTIRIGATFEEHYQIQTRDSSNALANVDITGATFTCKLRSALSSGTVIATPTVSIAAAATGKIDIKIEEATTGALTVGRGVWDLYMTLDSDVTFIAEGKYEIVQRVAR